MPAQPTAMAAEGKISWRGRKAVDADGCRSGWQAALSSPVGTLASASVMAMGGSASFRHKLSAGAPHAAAESSMGKQARSRKRRL